MRTETMQINLTIDTQQLKH